MTGQAVLITGVNGGIGQALAKGFAAAGWHVIGTDIAADTPAPDLLAHYYPLDLARLAREDGAAGAFMTAVAADLPAGTSLKCLVNNAAAQHLGATADVSLEDWHLSMDTNLSAPFFLSQAFLANAGTAPVIINVSSVHATATKAAFVAYATSKAALSGLTRAMAVDLAGKARVVGIAPAAIATPMLLDGFKGYEDKYQELAAAHPSSRIGEPAEVAAAALYLASDGAGFMNGTVIGLDGGIMARLHDPV